ncbi:hypothetical protein DPM19_20260 [Actinomadura craniellae]|uniref:DUF732 domain-containing protein n=1 Tax=Actinomadura craniellae TaxID=2231787 RepID=A0A365H2S0_9ACTN|nr:DUF732 domain-containing protein [Actinomadura craniellae]RAY13404.1 hypothetical protein DPM19_20260 [Actinomadura craniellae]
MSPKMPLIILSLALLAGCSSEGDPSSAASSPPPPPTTLAPPSPGTQPEVKPEDQTKFIQALTQVDKKLAADGGMMLIKAVETCTDIQQGKSGAELLDRVKRSYAVTEDAKAQQILKATQTYICPGLIKQS